MSEYHNPVSQAERRAIVTAKAERAHNSYFERAQAQIGEEMGGRFKRLSPVPVTGVPTIPTLPASSPWSAPDPTGLEPPLGINVHQLEAVGTEIEIQRSLASPDHPPVTGGSALEARAASPSAVETKEADPPSLLRRI